MNSQVERLSRRHRDCLRLVDRGLSTKEIARELDLAPGTVASYCTEALQILGVANRRQAALLLREAEIAPSEQPPSPRGVAETTSSPPASDHTGRRTHFLGPLAPANRDADNDASILSRLAWIIVLAIGIAVGFGSILTSVHTISDLVRH